MADHAFPDLVAQHSHRPGFEEPKSFEETLRDVLRSSPYLVISMVFHTVVIFLFASASVPPEAAKSSTIKATAEPLQEIIPPPPEPPPPEVEPLDRIIEDPVVSESEVVEEQEEIITEYDLLPKGDADTGQNDIIGVGGGGLAGGGGGKFGRRGGAGGAGGTPINRAVDDALRWLANHQSADGYWSCAAFDTECGKLGNDVICDGAGSDQFDVGVTALSLLAFLGHGDTHKSGKWKTTVKKGLKYLVDVQQLDGNFGIDTNYQYTYDHILATLAMVEAYALTQDGLFRKPATRGLEYMYKIRNPGKAWRYSPESPAMVTNPNDMSVTGWAIMAMTSAKECRLPLDKTAFEDSLLFLEEMTDPATGVTGYYQRGGRSPRMPGQITTWPDNQTEAMTAVGVLCRIFADPELTRPGNRELIEKGIGVMSRLPPLWSDDAPGRRDFYYWYYGTYALFQCNTPELATGKEAWQAWEATLIGNIAEHQHRDGERTGSWDPQVDPWGSDGGRVYSTAILCLTMEVFYRYDTVLGAH